MAAFDRAPAATCNTLRTYHLLSTGVTSATRSSSHGQGGGSPTSRGHHSLARSPLSTRVRAVFTVISYSPVAYTVNAASNRRRRLVPSRVASRPSRTRIRNIRRNVARALSLRDPVLTDCARQAATWKKIRIAG